jgi:hypothetical protein
MPTSSLALAADRLRSARACCISLAIWLCLLASQTRAQGPAVSTLSWRAPSECPAQEAVRERVYAHLLARQRAPAQWEASARVVRLQRGYRLELEVRTPNAPLAERRLNATTCEELATATAVLIELALAPQLSAAAPDTAPAADSGNESSPAGVESPLENTPPPATATALPGAAPANAQPATGPPELGQPGEADREEEVAIDGGASRLAIGVLLGAALRMDLGSLPQSPGFGLQARVGLRWGALQANAGLTIWLSGTTVPDLYQSATLEGRALFGDLALGVAVTDRPLRVFPQILFEFGELWLEVSQISDPDPQHRWWAAAGLGVETAYVLPAGFELVAGVAGELPFSRPRALVRTSTGGVPVFTVAAFLLRLSVGVNYVFE